MRFGKKVSITTGGEKRQQQVERLHGAVSHLRRQQSQRRDISIPTFRDDFSYQRGTHNFQMGGTFKPIHALSNEVLDLNEITLGLGGGRLGFSSLVRPGDILTQNPDTTPTSVGTTEYDASLAFTVGRFAQLQQMWNQQVLGGQKLAAGN